MNQFKKACSVMMLTFVIFLSVTRVGVDAATHNASRSAYSVSTVNVTTRELSYFVSVKETDVKKYPSVKIYLGKRYINAPSYLINDTTYIPLRALSEVAGATVTFDSRTREARVTMAGLDMRVADKSYVVYANERPIASAMPAMILSDGRMYVPIRSIAKVLSLTVEWRASREVILEGEPTPLAHANDFYVSDEVYWLSRVISAEAQGESLLGQIAVGNVVQNRVKSQDFPNTIWGVIFDRKHGVQFSPVANGSIYREPTYTATLAAKICLEGLNVNKGVLFFMEPTKSTSSWIANNRQYAFTVENHNFFY